MKKLYRTTSIVGFSLMPVPLFFLWNYATQQSHILYLRFAIISFLLVGILLSFNAIDVIKLNSLKKNGQCFSLRIISLAPINVIHVRGFYTFRIIAEYKDGNGIKHKIHTVAYSVLDFCSHLKLESFYIDNLNANIYIKNSVYCIEVIYHETMRGL